MVVNLNKVLKSICNLMDSLWHLFRPVDKILIGIILLMVIVALAGIWAGINPHEPEPFALTVCFVDSTRVTYHCTKYYKEDGMLRIKHKDGFTGINMTHVLYIREEVK